METLTSVPIRFCRSSTKPTIDSKTQSIRQMTNNSLDYPLDSSPTSTSLSSRNSRSNDQSAPSSTHPIDSIARSEDHRTATKAEPTISKDTSDYRFTSRIGFLQTTRKRKSKSNVVVQCCKRKWMCTWQKWPTVNMLMLSSAMWNTWKRIERVYKQCSK